MATLDFPLNPIAGIVSTLAALDEKDLLDGTVLGAVLQQRAEAAADLCSDIAGPRGCYRRSLLYRTDRFELLLLQWGAGAQSAVHDHAGQTCVFTVLCGELAVDDFVAEPLARSGSYVPIHQTGSGVVTPGALDSRKGAADIHRVRCERPALSLHVYAHPIARCGIYCPQTFSRQSARLKYDDVRVDLLQPSSYRLA